MIAAYTRAGDLIVDLDASPAVRAAADWLDRRHTTPSTHAGQHPLLPKLIIDRLPSERVGDLHGMAERIRALRSALLPGGHLIIAVPTTAPARPTGDHDATPDRVVDPVTNVISAARTASMTYQQHLVTVHDLVPEPAPDDLPPPLVGHRHPITHSYLLVFRFGPACATQGGGQDG